MFNLSLKNLDRQNIYTEVLRMSECLCDEYRLYTHFGIISMANQYVVEYLTDLQGDFSVDMEVDVGSDRIAVAFHSDMPLFEGFAGRAKDMQPIPILTDKFIISADNKSVAYMFHVKPHISLRPSAPAGVFRKVKKTL